MELKLSKAPQIKIIFPLFWTDLYFFDFFIDDAIIFFRPKFLVRLFIV